MIVSFKCNSHYLCHKKSRLLFVLFSTTSGDRTTYPGVSQSLATLTRCFHSYGGLMFCTVTCRQFPNLTFAPRKTCNGFFHHSNLALLCYHVTARYTIHYIKTKCKHFFQKNLIFLQTLFIAQKRLPKQAAFTHCIKSKHCIRAQSLHIELVD